MSFSKFTFLTRFVLAAVFCAGSLVCNFGFGQDFEELDVADKYYVDPDAGDSREEKQKNREARNAIKVGEDAVQAILLSGRDVNVPEVNEYFDGFVFPSMTKAKNLADAGRLRYDFDRDFLGTKYVGSNRSGFISNVVIPGLKKIINNDKLLPAARVNAVVLMSRLDDAPLVRSTKTPPRPSLTAFDELLTIWQGDFPEYLKATSLSGLLRHVEVDSVLTASRIPPDRSSALMQSVTGMMDRILTDDAELKVDLNRWKLTKAIQLMSKMKLPAQYPDYYNRMLSILDKDKKISKWIKLEAVRGIRQLVRSGFVPQDLPAMVEKSAAFAATTLGEEAKLVKAKLDELIYENILWEDTDLEVTGSNYASAPGGGMGMGGGMGGPGMGMGGPGMGMGGPGMGMGGPGMGMGGPGMGMGGPGMGMGGGFGSDETEQAKPKPIVELPNFELNLARRRMKLVAGVVQQLLEEDAITRGLGDPHKAELTKLNELIDSFMVDSNVGIIDLAKVDDDEEVQEESFTTQLQKVCEKMALDAADVVSRMKGEEPADRDAATAEAGAVPFGADAPSADAEAQPFGGN